MNYFLVICSILLSFNIYADSSKNLYDLSIQASNGDEIHIKDFKNKPILLVSIATRCGYTKQLDDIEALYQKLKTKDLIVLGIPSNDFGSQTPEDDAKVADFCKLKYGVKFPLTKKVVVIGDKAHPLIKYAVKESGGKEIRWNFEKFLFNSDGKFKARYESSKIPTEKEILAEIN